MNRRPLLSFVFTLSVAACGGSRPQSAPANATSSSGGTSSAVPASASNTAASSEPPAGAERESADARMHRCMQARERDFALACLVMTALEEQLPQARIEIVDALTLRLRNGDHDLQLNLDNLRRAVSAAADDDAARETIIHWLGTAIDAANGGTLPQGEAATLDNILPTVRPADMVAQLQAGTYVAEPFLPGLVRLYVADFPDHMRYVQQDEVTALHLDAAGLRSRALANLEQHSAAIASLQPTARGEFRELNVHDSYDADRIQLHDAWRTLGASGHLMVAIPSRDVLLYSTRDDAAAVIAMTTLVHQRFTTDHHPVSDQLFRWTPTGWDPIASNSRRR